MAMLKRALLLLALTMGSVSGSAAHDWRQEQAELDTALAATRQRVARLPARPCALTVEWDRLLTLFENETAHVRNDPQSLAEPEDVSALEKKHPNWSPGDIRGFAGYIHVFRGVHEHLNNGFIAHAELLSDRICAAATQLAHLKRREREQRRGALAKLTDVVNDMQQLCRRIAGDEAAVVELLHRHRPEPGGAQQIYDTATDGFLRGLRRMGPQRNCGGRSALLALAETAVDEMWSPGRTVIEGHKISNRDQRRIWQSDLELRVRALLDAHAHGSDAGRGGSR